MVLSAGAVVSLVDVKDHLGITTNTDDGALERVIEGVGEVMGGYVGMRLKRTGVSVVEWSEVRDHWVNLAQYVEGDGVVEVRLVYGEGVADRVLGVAEFEVREGMVYVLVEGVDRIMVRISYDAGWSVVPADLQLAALHIVTMVFGRRKKIDVRGERVFQVDSSLVVDVLNLPLVREVLERYRRINL